MTATTNAVKTASAAKTARIAEREPIKFVKRIPVFRSYHHKSLGAKALPNHYKRLKIRLFL